MYDSKEGTRDGPHKFRTPTLCCIAQIVYKKFITPDAANLVPSSAILLAKSAKVFRFFFLTNHIFSP